MGFIPELTHRYCMNKWRRIYNHESSSILPAANVIYRVIVNTLTGGGHILIAVLQISKNGDTQDRFICHTNKHSTKST